MFPFLNNMRSLVENGRLKPVWVDSEPFSDFLLRCGSPKMNPLFWDFWRDLCESIKKTMQVELRVMEEMFPPSPPGDEYRLYFSQSEPTCLAESTKPETATSDTARDPPKQFSPLPKTELGGCARSDSLVRLLVFWRAVPPVQFML